jgi:hypothetical protein
MGQIALKIEMSAWTHDRSVLRKVGYRAVKIGCFQEKDRYSKPAYR